MAVRRRRRTAEEAKALVLQVAERRLREHGLDGLNITGVAEEAGMSHATVLHHFGSVAGMRDALAAQMVLALIQDVASALSSGVSPDQLLQNLFTTLTEGQHSTLMAWRAIESRKSANDPAVVAKLFERMLDSTQNELNIGSPSDARQLIYLVSCAAIGHSLSGRVLTGLLQMPEEEQTGFPKWMNARLSEK